jgi:uncharacterized protein (DUF488 family)
MRVFTIGHSNRSIVDFVGLLRSFGVEKVVDIRTIPRSRHNPQFNQDSLRSFLKNKRIGYQLVKELGGLRHAKKDSVNVGWKNLSFRGFADYMGSEDFEKGLSKLQRISRKKVVAFMCAEAVPWRCHRSLVADALSVKGWKVYHIQSKTSARFHKRTSFLRVRNKGLVYV